MRKLPRLPVCIAVAAILACTLGCRTTGRAGDAGSFSVEILRTRTIPDLGAGQGIAIINGRIYLYGDAETGVVREYTFDRSTLDLIPTGRTVRLTRSGQDIVPHPTGLTHHPDSGTLLGDTVNRIGVIWSIDLERALTDGTLDHAIRNQTVDDAARNGTRPEFVRTTGRWLVATADYGNTGNELRLYRPENLSVASRTSAPGVMSSRAPGPDLVQSLHWHDASGLLFAARNITPGLGYRITAVRLDPDDGGDILAWSIDLSTPTDELEGLAIIEGFAASDTVYCLLLSSAATDNLHIARITLPSPAITRETVAPSGPSH